MFKKILIANRGEIAVTIIRACRELGIKTVAVCSEADRSALHAQLADDCVCIGPAPARDSYLNAQAILTACTLTGAEAIHPGYGFLSESPTFARMCEKCQITFIGPPARVIELMGDKTTARQTAIEAGVPVIPGTPGVVGSLSDAIKAAEEIGYPVMVKASSGGGGRGIRIAVSHEELPDAYQAAKSEALACFGDDRVYIERFVRDPRHIEIQLLADKNGRVVHFGERDCSIQRRNQKILEEARSPFIDNELREQMGAAAVRLAEHTGYCSVGTVEFLVDADRNFYFMEMNTRIQVEHPVSEAITGFNLIREQIKVAYGLPLKFSQKNIEFRGHSIECRINAEDPGNGFRPSPGTIASLCVPGGPGIRLDSAIYQGYTIPPYYDSLIAKLIVHAPDRRQAIARMRRALTEFLITGVETNIDFHLAILRDQDFIAGNYTIGYLGLKTENFLDRIIPGRKER
ncbi:MAG: acetyl-CoA carboxylase biotin carboxylase subunit [Clostridiaceae bacterium]|jgi:acetyl-CoA carboxylase biotin carboxylase subunit|nr:acetyl-CoA carboxylase biotin carboxylase subunit [Clostridiaceae bacterium]